MGVTGHWGGFGAASRRPGWVQGDCGAHMHGHTRRPAIAHLFTDGELAALKPAVWAAMASAMVPLAHHNHRRPAACLY